MCAELGRIPTADEYLLRVRGSENTLRLYFGNYESLLKASAIEQIKNPFIQAEESKLLHKYKRLCARKELIQSFTRHVIDLKEMFDRAGNPRVLKLSAQPDTHAKFVDHKAFNAYLKFLEYWKPDVHLILGDFIDCEGLSHWESSDLEPRRIVPEMKQARKMLEQILSSTPASTTRIYLEGNHERWVTEAFSKMPELFDGLDQIGLAIDVKKLLNLDHYGYEFFPLNDLIQIGKAHFTHGYYTQKHHAMKHMDEFKTNIYYGHLHDLQEANNVNVDGPIEASSLGCLCRLDAKFLKGRKNNWAHAHGCFEFFPDGTYQFHKLRILNGRMAYNGIVFEG